MKIRITLTLLALLTAIGTTLAQNTPGEDTKAGIEMYRSGKLSEAITQFKRIVETDKKDYDAWLYLGAAYLRMDQKKEALKAFRTASRGRQARYKRPILEKTLENRPLVILNKPTLYLSQQHRTGRILGSVTLAIEFRYDGTMGFIFPVHPLPDGLTELSISAARTFNFQPAHNGGKPVTTVILYDFIMEEQY